MTPPLANHPKFYSMTGHGEKLTLGSAEEINDLNPYTKYTSAT